MPEASQRGSAPPLRLPVLRLPAGWRHLSEDELFQRAAQAYLAHRASSHGLDGPAALLPPGRPEGLKERRQADRRGPSSWPEPEPRLPSLPAAVPNGASDVVLAAHGPSTAQKGDPDAAAVASVVLSESEWASPAELPNSASPATRSPSSSSGWFLVGGLFLAVVQVLLALVALAPKAFDPRPGQQRTDLGTNGQAAPAPAQLQPPPDSAMSLTLPPLTPSPQVQDAAAPARPASR